MKAQVLLELKKRFPMIISISEIMDNNIFVLDDGSTAKIVHPRRLCYNFTLLSDTPLFYHYIISYISIPQQLLLVRQSNFALTKTPLIDIT